MDSGSLHHRNARKICDFTQRSLQDIVSKKRGGVGCNSHLPGLPRVSSFKKFLGPKMAVEPGPGYS